MARKKKAVDKKFNATDSFELPPKSPREVFIAIGCGDETVLIDGPEA